MKSWIEYQQMKRSKKIENMFKFTGLVKTHRDKFFAEVELLDALIIKPIDQCRRLLYVDEDMLCSCHEDGNKVVLDFHTDRLSLEIQFSERQICRRVIKLICEFLR